MSSVLFLARVLPEKGNEETVVWVGVCLSAWGWGGGGGAVGVMSEGWCPRVIVGGQAGADADLYADGQIVTRCRFNVGPAS